jgi:hypothetical protein
MAVVKAANVTKWEAGGSGDNIIADGYIKTVEKVWIDTYTVAAAIPSTTSILIGKVPKGKKLTDVIVFLPVLSGAATQTTVNCSTTILGACGTTGTLGYLGVGANTGATGPYTATHSVVRLQPTAALTEMSADSDIYIMVDPATTITGGTIRSIVKYT